MAAGSDPSAQRKAERAARADTIEAIAREWLDVQSHSLDPRTFRKKLERFQQFVFPYLGKQPIAHVTTRNRPSIVDPARIGELMRAIAGYRGDVSTEFALRLLPLTFVRPGELRLAQWSLHPNGSHRPCVYLIRPDVAPDT